MSFQTRLEKFLDHQCIGMGRTTIHNASFAEFAELKLNQKTREKMDHSQSMEDHIAISASCRELRRETVLRESTALEKQSDPIIMTQKRKSREEIDSNQSSAVISIDLFTKAIWIEWLKRKENIMKIR